MTKKIFWQDPYLTEFETTLNTVNGNQVTVFMSFLEARNVIMEP
ncbi:hypothetical protein OQJ19_09855 [Fluoribacter gormanii]|uniref:Uncharacterized protein n=1 Tax=Fluoribacter gormanii TaxID=464 RepID=A0A377GMB3_9GAMM|nr:hypothetical protein [Fluoribacter gormanii]MCW8470947.1 hypothetical protein [Fluoribacter gormanii]SIQ61047.1 hypothetical protein SAMN05421777_10234 [Fluoribacter gormanii]STO25931.1 Uncharacterised protein [Fluoribacter gormanii]